MDRPLKLLGEYFLMPALDSGQREWLKLELWLDGERARIYPRLYARDEFRVVSGDDEPCELKKWFWFEECGWFLPWGCAVLTISEEEAVRIVQEYVERRMRGEDVPEEVQRMLYEES